jgi:hypothetical protein
MGIVPSDALLIESVLKSNPHIRTVCELGSQNLYLEPSDKPPFASGWYEARGLEYTCIDLAGDNNAVRLDLSVPLAFPGPVAKAALVTDFGTSEHVVTTDGVHRVAFHDDHIHSIYPTKQPTRDQILTGYYNCWLNKYNLLEVNGIMISVTPKTGNWPAHGYVYLTTAFYECLVAQCRSLEAVAIDETPALGNTVDGWNVRAVLRKISGDPFMNFEVFAGALGPQIFMS